MSLSDEHKKMSKTDPSSCLFLTDPPELIHKKILKAKTDAFTKISYDRSERRPLANLIDIFAALKDVSVEEVVLAFADLGHRQFKEELCSLITEFFREFRYNYEHISDRACLDILKDSEPIAHEYASKTLRSITNKIGFI